MFLFVTWPQNIGAMQSEQFTFWPVRMNEVDLDMPLLQAIEDRNVPLSRRRAPQRLPSHGHLVCKPLKKEW